jgi:hypothetical protein
MTYKKKSWKEKLEDSKKFPKILEFNPKFPCGKALIKMGAKSGDSVVLAAPLEVDEIMKKIPKGKLITINEICKKLAKKHNVKFCCTLTTGIFIMTAAHAAEEDKIKDMEKITPYWRTLKMEGLLNGKYPGGVKAQKKLLEDEGFKIIQNGKKYFVENYKNYLVN